MNRYRSNYSRIWFKQKVGQCVLKYIK